MSSTDMVGIKTTLARTSRDIREIENGQRERDPSLIMTLARDLEAVHAQLAEVPKTRRDQTMDRMLLDCQGYQSRLDALRKPSSGLSRSKEKAAFPQAPVHAR